MSDSLELSSHGQFATVEIEVIPQQAEHLTLA
jgi:hypothetical protein